MCVQNKAGPKHNADTRKMYNFVISRAASLPLGGFVRERIEAIMRPEYLPTLSVFLRGSQSSSWEYHLRLLTQIFEVTLHTDAVWDLTVLSILDDTLGRNHANVIAAVPTLGDTAQAMKSVQEAVAIGKASASSGASSHHVAGGFDSKTTRKAPIAAGDMPGFRRIESSVEFGRVTDYAAQLLRDPARDNVECLAVMLNSRTESHADARPLSTLVQLVWGFIAAAIAPALSPLESAPACLAKLLGNIISSTIDDSLRENHLRGLEKQLASKTWGAPDGFVNLLRPTMILTAKYQGRPETHTSAHLVYTTWQHLFMVEEPGARLFEQLGWPDSGDLTGDDVGHSWRDVVTEAMQIWRKHGTNGADVEADDGLGKHMRAYMLSILNEAGVRYNAIRYVTNATVKLDPKFREPQSPSQRSLDEYIIQRELKAARARTEDSERPAVDDSDKPGKAKVETPKKVASDTEASGHQQDAPRGSWKDKEYQLLGKSYSKESADAWLTEAGVDPKSMCLPFLFGIGSCTVESCMRQCRGGPEHESATSAAHQPVARWKASAHRTDIRARKRADSSAHHKGATGGVKKRK